MAKILFSIIALILLCSVKARADYSASPFILLYTSNTFQSVQTFVSSVTFVDGRMMINGVAYTWPTSATNGNCLQYNGGVLSWATCGSGGSSKNYPDWTIDGTTNVNSETSNSITVRDITMNGDLRIYNLYTTDQ